MADRREYGMISKRSRQILGEEVLPKSGGSSGQLASCSSQRALEPAAMRQDKRRSQVLQAQRTHRQRTQTYIKMLEREVLRLRESERVALEHAQSLQQQVDEMRQMLAEVGVSPAATTTTTTSERSGWSDAYEPPSYGHVTASISGNRGVYVNVDFSGVELQSGHNGHDGHPLHSSWGSGSGSPPSATTTPSPAAAPGPSKAFLSDPRVGVEFVLRLETDCMDHLRGKHLDHVHDSMIDSESDISGHVSTACLSLWQQQTSSLSATASYSISSAELERLLGSSLNLGLAPPEITPVQVWNRVRWLDFSGGREALEELTRELKDHVFCLGFGAVLHESIVEEILQRYFVLPLQ